jgi:hypothetical protein
VAFLEPSMIKEIGSPWPGWRARRKAWAFWPRTASGSHRSPQKKLLKRVRWCSASRSRYRVATLRRPPHKGHGHNQQAEGHAMIPVKVPFQRLKKGVQGGGNAYDAEPGAVLLLPLAGGR